MSFDPLSTPGTPSNGTSSPFGLHRVVEPAGQSLPQAARVLDARPELWPDEVRIDIETLNLDAASFRQLSDKHHGDGQAVREEVLAIVGERGKMQNPVTGSGGMLIGTVAEVGPESPLGLQVGDRVATLVSLSLTPLVIRDRLERWTGSGERVPASGHAILFGRSIAAKLPDDLSPELALMVMDVCGAPALVARTLAGYVSRYAGRPSPVPNSPIPPVRDTTDVPNEGNWRVGDDTRQLEGDLESSEAALESSDASEEALDASSESRSGSVIVLGGAGKSGSLSLAAAAQVGATRRVAVVRDEDEAALLEGTGLATHVVVADARNPLGLSEAVASAGGPADLTVVCVDVTGCEQPAIMATAEGGTVIFFSMATNFAAAALGAEGLAADVTMLVGNGYVPGHAAYALDLLRETPSVRELFEARLSD